MAALSRSRRRGGVDSSSGVGGRAFNGSASSVGGFANFGRSFANRISGLLGRGAEVFCGLFCGLAAGSQTEGRGGGQEIRNAHCDAPIRREHRDRGALAE